MGTRSGITRSMLERPDDPPGERADLANAVMGAPKEPHLSRLERLRLVVSEHQCRRIEGHLVDGVTAAMLVMVHDALNDANKAKFLALPLTKMVTVGWKLTK